MKSFIYIKRMPAKKKAKKTRAPSEYQKLLKKLRRKFPTLSYRHAQKYASWHLKKAKCNGLILDATVKNAVERAKRTVEARPRPGEHFGPDEDEEEEKAHILVPKKKKRRLKSKRSKKVSDKFKRMEAQQQQPKGRMSMEEKYLHKMYNYIKQPITGPKYSEYNKLLRRFKTYFFRIKAPYESHEYYEIFNKIVNRLSTIHKTVRTHQNQMSVADWADKLTSNERKWRKEAKQIENTIKVIIDRESKLEE